MDPLHKWKGSTALAKALREGRLQANQLLLDSLGQWRYGHGIYSQSRAVCVLFGAGESHLWFCHSVMCSKSKIAGGKVAVGRMFSSVDHAINYFRLVLVSRSVSRGVSGAP